MRRAAASLLCFASLTAAGGPARAQQPPRQRLRVRVEYIAGSNLYLSAGAETGLQSGDTLRAARPDGSVLGPLRVVATSSGRAVVTFAAAPFAVTRGDSLLVDAPLRARPEPAAADASPPQPRAPAAVPARASPARHPRLDGRLAFDVDALRSETDADGLRAAGTRTFTTPAVRLHAVATELPGDARLQVNLRYARRQGFTGALATPSSLRVYQLSLEKDIAPLRARLRLGRFHDPYDPYGGYWDGAMVRVGGALGVGVIAGVEPDRGNEGLGDGARKVGAFLDYAYRGPFTWDGALSAQRQTGDALRPDHEHVALQQRVRLGDLRLSQRLRVERDGAHAWTLGQLDFAATAPLGGGLSARAHYAARRDALPWLGGERGPRRTRYGAGLAWADAALSATADVAATTWDGVDPTTSLSGSLALHRGPLSLQPGVSASWWTGPGGHALFLAPRIGRPIGRARIELAWQHYRGRFGDLQTRSDGGDIMLTAPLADRLHATLRAAGQRGDGYTSLRLFTSLWLAL